MQRYIFPRLNVDQTATQFEEMTLKGIVWHSGQSIASGHYTASAKRNGQWYMTNDQRISQNNRFSSDPKEGLIPYLLLCKKPTSCSSVKNVSSTTRQDENIQQEVTNIFQKNKALNDSLAKRDLTSYFTTQIKKDIDA